MMTDTLRNVALAGLIVGAFVLPAKAADSPDRPPRPIVANEEVVPVIVVPDCRQSFGAVLLGCAPRGISEAPDALEVQAILSTVQRPRRAPYPQLLDRP